MSKVIVSNIMSADGFYEGPDRNMMVLNMDASFDAYNLERLASAGSVLLGRTSYEGFSSYWPHIAGAPADPANRALDQVNREISRVYNELPKVVVSDTYRIPEDNPWAVQTTVIGRSEVTGWRAAAPEGDILVFGSRTMWNGLLSQGLVDELHLMVSPNAVGSGTPTFDHPVDLDLLDVRRFDGSGNVLLRYAPRRVVSGGRV